MSTAIAAVVLACAPGPALAQQREHDADPVEAYLERLELEGLLAEHLRKKLDRVPRQERVGVAERLSRIYARMLRDETRPEARSRVLELAEELLAAVPEADSFELRINLAQTMYRRAEDVAERWRLRLADEKEVEEAVVVLRTVKGRLEEIATRLHGEVERLERREERGDDAQLLQEALAERRRLRSLAFYYAGWSSYYLGLMRGGESLAVDALRNFGWLLNSRGRPATVDRLPESLLRYEHIARAAVGCAMAEALRGNDDRAVQWLDAVESASDLAQPVREQMLTRRIAVYGAGRRWADLERTVRIARRAGRGGEGVNRLETVDARLLAVVALEAERRLAGDVLEELAATALSDLVARGEIAHVLDLVDRYGTAPIGDSGFVVHYVRGLQRYERARQAHRESDEDPGKPARGASLVNAYRAAASMLEAALNEADAVRFGAERADALLRRGLSLHYAGQPTDAAAVLMLASEAATDAALAEEAAWMAIVSLDETADAGDERARMRRDELAAVFLRNYPDSERAAAILVRGGSRGLVDDDEALEILLGVDRSSPLHRAATRQAAGILYRIYRAQRTLSGRESAASRFLHVAEEALEAEVRAVFEEEGARAQTAAERALALARQIMDAAMGIPSPDVGRAMRAMQAIHDVAARRNLDLARVEAELLYRQVQISLVQGRAEDAASAAERLRDAPGQFADAADRLLYRHALAVWERDETAEAARDVVRFGSRVVARTGSTESALADPGVLSVHMGVARAAAAVWAESGERGMLELALRMDEAVLSVRPRAAESLRRVAELAEAAGDPARALDCWRTLLSGRREGTEAWYEARYHSLRLLAEDEPERAASALRQHRVLHPDPAPQPWEEKLRELESLLAAMTAGDESGGGG